MRTELVKLHQDLQATMIYVTHDQVEAMTMADRIVVLNGGIQVGSHSNYSGRSDRCQWIPRCMRRLDGAH